MHAVDNRGVGPQFGRAAPGLRAFQGEHHLSHPHTGLQHIRHHGQSQQGQVAHSYYYDAGDFLR